MTKRARQDIFGEDFLARLQRLHLIAKRLTAGGAAGLRRSRRVGDGLEFADHRDYAAGDDVRFVDWPYFARMEKLLLRLFHEHSEAGVTVLLDASASMAPGGAMEKFDYALQTAAAMTYVAMASLERVTVMPFADDLRPPLQTGRDRGQILSVLDYLAGIEPGGPTRLGACVDKFVRRHAPAGAVLLVTDLLEGGEELSGALALLAQRRFETTVLHIYSASDASPQLAGPTLLQAAERAEQITVDVGEALLASYRQAWQQFQAGCEHTTRARGATYVAAATNLPFDRLVLEALRRAGVLG